MAHTKIFSRSDLDIPVALGCGCKILWHEGETLQRGVYAWCETHGDTSVVKLSHGGHRTGSGRKRLAKPIQTISVTLYATQVARLNKAGNASKALREILK
jgi:hypothetical protein